MRNTIPTHHTPSQSSRVRRRRMLVAALAALLLPTILSPPAVAAPDETSATYAAKKKSEDTGRAGPGAQHKRDKKDASAEKRLTELAADEPGAADMEISDGCINVAVSGKTFDLGEKCPGPESTPETAQDELSDPADSKPDPKKQDVPSDGIAAGYVNSRLDACDARYRDWVAPGEALADDEEQPWIAAAKERAASLLGFDPDQQSRAATPDESKSPAAAIPDSSHDDLDRDACDAIWTTLVPMPSVDYSATPTCLAAVVHQEYDSEGDDAASLASPEDAEFFYLGPVCQEERDSNQEATGGADAAKGDSDSSGQRRYYAQAFLLATGYLLDNCEQDFGTYALATDAPEDRTTQPAKENVAAHLGLRRGTQTQKDLPRGSKSHDDEGVPRLQYEETCSGLADIFAEDPTSDPSFESAYLPSAEKSPKEKDPKEKDPKGGGGRTSRPG